jgi:murein DD-endopeptidase MepM/ murein hydrolase activator NlpD
VQTVDMNQNIYRGQIVGITGNTGVASGGFPQLHFNLQESKDRGWQYFDIYRTTINLNPLPNNYWGSEISYWTVDNLPVFPN